MTQNQVSTLRKGLLVLEFIVQSKGVTLSDVMRHMKLSKSTAFRTLTTLEKMNYIYKIQANYFFNTNVFGTRAYEYPPSDWQALHSLFKIAKDMNMSTYLGKLDGTDLVMTQVIHAPFTSTAADEIGDRSKVHLSALGKVILAHLQGDKLTELFERMSLEPATVNTFNDSQLFRYHLKAIRDEGFAFDDEERNIGIRCVAVPVFRSGEVIAALAIAAPTKEITRNNKNEIARKLKTGSTAVTTEIEALNI